MVNPTVESVYNSKNNLIESFFHLFNGTENFSLSQEDILWLLGKSKSLMNPEFFQLLSQIGSITSKESSVSFNIGKKISSPVQIGGMPLNLTASETITANINSSSMSMIDIKGLSASMGFMAVDLRGVKFKRDGQSFLVDLETPMKTFSIKIPVI